MKSLRKRNINERGERLSIIEEFSSDQEESHVSWQTETIRSDSPVESDLENQSYTSGEDDNLAEKESKEEESPKPRN